MAKTNNLTDFLKDIADTIRANDGTSAKINPQDFSDRIQLETKEVSPTTNEQTITPSTGKYGIKSVKINAIESGEGSIVLDSSKTNTKGKVQIKLFGSLGDDTFITNVQSTDNRYKYLGSSKIGYVKPKNNYKLSMTKNGFVDNNSNIKGLFEEELNSDVISASSTTTISNNLEDLYVYIKNSSLLLTKTQPSNDYTLISSASPSVDDTLYLKIEKGYQEKSYIVIPSLKDLENFAVDDSVSILTTNKFDETNGIGSSIAVGASASLKGRRKTVNETYILTIPRGYHNETKYCVFDPPTEITLPSTTSTSTTYTQIYEFNANTDNDQYINIPTGYNKTETAYKIKKVSKLTLPTTTSSDYTTGYGKIGSDIVANTISDQYINIPTGYNTNASFYKIKKLKELELSTLLSDSNTSGESINWNKVRDITINDLKGTGYKYIDVPQGYNNTNSYYKIQGIPFVNFNIKTTADHTISTTQSISSSSNDQYLNIPQGYNENAISIKINKQSDLDGDAIAENVLSGKTFYGNSYTKLTGTMPTSTLPTSASSSPTSGYTNKIADGINPSTSTQYINIPTGYNDTAVYYKINAMPSMSLPTATEDTSIGNAKITGGISWSEDDRYINIPTGYNGVNAYYKINGIPKLTFPTNLITNEPTSMPPVFNVNKVAEITPSASNKYLYFNSNGYVRGLDGNYYTIKGDANLVASNIKSGVSIFGVQGTYDATSTSTLTLPTSASSTKPQLPYMEKASVTPSTSDKYIAIGTGYNNTNAYYTIKGDQYLLSRYIKSGITIFGVNGSYSPDYSGYGTDISIRDENSNDLYVNGMSGQDGEEIILPTGRNNLLITDINGDTVWGGDLISSGLDTQNNYFYVANGSDGEFLNETIQSVIDDWGIYDEMSLDFNDFANVEIRDENGDALFGAYIESPSMPTSFQNARNYTWSKGSSSYTYLCLKSSVSCLVSVANSTTTSSSYYKQTVLSANTNTYIGRQYASAAFPFTSIMVSGNFAANSTLDFYAGTSTSTSTSYNCKITVPKACKMILIRLYYTSSTSSSIHAYFIN